MEKKNDGKKTKSDERRTNDDDRRTVKRQKGERKSGDRRTNDDDKRTVKRQKGERKSDERRTNDDGRRTVRRQNDDDKRTVRRQKGEAKSDDKRTEKKLRGDIRKICESQKVINTRLNEFSGRLDGVEQQIDQVGLKFNRIEKEFQENKEEIERKLEDTRRQVQKEILERIEGLGHQLHRTSITGLGDGSTSPDTPLQHSSLMHTERSVHKMLKPPTYDGQSSWSMYRRQFEAAAKANGWTPQEMATSLVISLRGQALEILQEHPGRAAKRLRQDCRRVRNKSRQQRSNESLQEYEADIERLIHLAYPQAPKEFLEQIGIQTFIDGLVDTEMQQALRLGRHATISDALIAALEFKAAKEASRNYKPKIASEKFGKRQIVDARGSVSTTYTQSPKISVSKISSDERSLIVHGYLDDKWCSFVIDTGATRTILRPDILPKSSKELSRHVKLETATGEMIPVHGELNVKIQLGSKIMYHRVLTADIRDDCIVGLDILSKHGFVVDVKNRIIQIQNEEIVMVPKFQDYNQSRRIIVEEDIRIPQGSENIIIAKLYGNGEGLRTGIVEASERNDGLLVARSLVQINNQIPKNEVLGRCEPVEKIVKCEEVNQARTNPSKIEDGWSSEELKKSQKKDNDLKLIRSWVKNGVRPTWQEVSRYGTTIKGYWAQWNSLCLRDGLLHRKWESPDGVSAVYQLVLPKARIHQVLEELHNSPTGGHFGVTRTLARVRDRFYWVNCRRDVEEWCKRCDLCSAKKGPKQEAVLPTDLMLGRPLDETEERSLPEFVEDLRERMDRIHRFAREKLKIHSDKMKQRLDTTSTETAFKPNPPDWFVVEDPPPRTEDKREESDPEDYSASVNAIIQKKNFYTKITTPQRSQGEFPFSPDVLPGTENSRRRSSVFTTSSGETAITMDENLVAEATQEEIFENIKLHKEVLSNVKMQPWNMRKKLKLVVQAKAYIKKHEGVLQERLAQSHSTRDMLATWNIYFVKRSERSVVDNSKLARHETDGR
ncbi:hypothetical protein NQ318_003633 [Aromia moschata]|uniref:Peptidase A2 domain-containing protein n=1 Tax=Aromia moschata TaxID=1265417 RepID=A0AAV8XRX4_9CUCU|nr:hypothetical protein NQ318_003633 [Aromia moschata]